MTDELREAANFLATEPISNFIDDHGCDQLALREYGMAGKRIADAYLAEHPADDGDSVTEEWFQSIGATWKHDDGHHWPDYLSLGPLEWYQFSYGMVALPTADHYEFTTRGQVRMACKLFGVTLTESAK